MILAKRFMNRPAAVAITTAIVVTLGGVAWAAQPSQHSMAACHTDLATFCAGVEAGGGKKVRCLAENRSKLSAECADALAEHQAGRASRLGGPGAADTPASPPSDQVAPPSGAMPPRGDASPSGLPQPQPLRANLRACRTDLATFCSGVEAGGGRKIKCLMQNQAKLGPDCAAAVTVGAAQRETAHEACRADAKTFCAAERGPARQPCMVAHKASLSPACAALVDRRASSTARQ